MSNRYTKGNILALRKHTLQHAYEKECEKVKHIVFSHYLESLQGWTGQDNQGDND